MPNIYFLFRLTFPLNSCLKYMYPPPSSTILANIVNALASVPKFYVQVNKIYFSKGMYLYKLVILLS